jgi:DNA modification methylase
METEPVVLERKRRGKQAKEPKTKRERKPREKKEKKTKEKTVKRRDFSKMTKKEKDLLEIRRKCIQNFRENV